MNTILPDIQKNIVEQLPEDGELALEVMCQLLANMTLSVSNATIDKTVERLKFHLAEYEGT